jgi:Pyruvate/2-oxoacid:ferredoxin oxidoreductase delta subunit
MNIKRTNLFFMSGTGNTLRVAQWLAAQARTHGLTAAVRDMETARATPMARPECAEMLGVLMPTHAFTAPWPVLRFVLGAPLGRGAAAFVLATRGGTKFGRVNLPGLEGTGLYLVALLLALKGWRVRGVLALDMPSNWTACHAGLAPWKVADIIGKAQPKAEKFFGALLAGHLRFGLGSFIGLALGALLAPVSLGYLLMGRFYLARLFFATERCNGCGLCARSCPFGVLKMYGRPPRPYWTWACESCMRCMSFCPERAIEAGHSWAVLLFYLAHLPLLAWLFGALAHVSGFVAPTSPMTLFWTRYSLQLFALAAAYAGFWWLIRIPLFNRLFAWTTFTRWYRRYHEPETQLEDFRK